MNGIGSIEPTQSPYNNRDYNLCILGIEPNMWINIKAIVMVKKRVLTWGVKFESILRFIFHPIFVPTLEIRFFQKIGFL
jgi:hypothetical protein